MAAITHHAGRLYTGTAAERGGLDTTPFPSGVMFVEDDTQDMYIWDGVAWQGFGTNIGGVTYLELDSSNDPLTAGLEINAATAAEPVLILQTTDDDTTNPVLEIQDSGDAVVFSIDVGGNVIMIDDAWIGIAGDIRIEFDQSDGDIMLHLGDDAGSDQVQILDSGPAVVAYIDSDGNAYFASDVSIGTAAPDKRLHVKSAADEGGIVIERGGAGQEMRLEFHNQVGAFHSAIEGSAAGPALVFIVGGGAPIDAVFIDANADVGIGKTPDQKFHVYTTVSMVALFEANAADAFSGFRVRADDVTKGLDAQMFGSAFPGNQFGIARADTTSLFASKCLFTLGTREAFDFVLGTSDVERMRITAAGLVGIGETTPLAKVHVDQSSATGAVPVLLLDQGDVSEQHILCSINGADVDFPAIIQLDVTGTPSMWWDESEDAFVFTNGLAIGDVGGGNYAAFAGDGDLSFTGTARIEWAKITANSVTLTVGASAEGVADLQTAHDGNFYHITEAAAAPGQDLIVDFISVEAFNWVNITCIYDGGATHAVAIQLYNWNTTAWDTFDAAQNAQEDVATASGYIVGDQSFFVPDDSDYIGTGGDAGKVRVRFYHTMLGNASHDTYIDVCALYQ